MQVKLEGVEETMLIPLLIKAEETKRPSPRIRDEKAVEMVSRIDYDFSKFKNKSFSHAGVVARTVIIDRETQKFISFHPDAVCITVGCGLDARFYRMDNGRIDWYDLDLSNVMDVRIQLLLEQGRVHRLAFSAFEEKWTAEVVVKGRPILIILEGLLMYFTEEEVRQLFGILKRNFPGGTVLAELMPAMLVNHGNQHETVKKTGANFRWGVKDASEVERFYKGIALIDEWSFNTEMKKYGLRFRLFGTLPMTKNFNNRLAVYRL